MEQIVIHGGRPLNGTVAIGGAKNAVLPIMAAALLMDGPVVLHRVPRLADVATMAGVLSGLGMCVDWTGPSTMRIEPHDRRPTIADRELVSAMRASICVLGPLLARRGRAELPPPGGCVIGDRPIDLHVRGLRALGAHIEEKDGGATAWATRLRGARVGLLGPHGTTVLGTANVLMAATLAQGQTVIEHVAREPEIQDLCNFLNACGARIGGIGTRTLIVDGVARLGGGEHTVIPDRIEAGTFLIAAAMTGGDVTLNGVRADHLAAVLRTLSSAGVRIETDGDQITANTHGGLLPINFATAPYPGLPTDIQPQLSALLCLADGRSRITERVYPRRFTHAPELAKMGGRIQREGEGATIDGVPVLHGAEVHAADLRAGAALILAGLAARGTTVITGTEQIDRGYESIEERLRRIGADVHRDSELIRRRSA